MNQHENRCESTEIFGEEISSVERRLGMRQTATRETMAMNQHEYRYPSDDSTLEWEPFVNGEGRRALVGHYKITQYYRPIWSYKQVVITEGDDVVETYAYPVEAVRHLYRLAVADAPAKVADVLARLQEEGVPHEVRVRPSENVQGHTFWSIHTRSADECTRAYALYAHCTPESGLRSRTSTRFVQGRVIGLRREFGARLAYSMLKTVAQIGRNQEPVEA
jgi:hypothetical protein